MDQGFDVQGVLDHIVRQHPDLKTLRNALPATLELTPQWLEQACAHPRYAIRGLMLRALLGDYRLGGDTQGVLDQETVNRIGQYVVHHPAKGLTHLAQGRPPIAHTLPKHFEMLFGLNRKNFLQGCADLVAHTLLGQRYGYLPGLPEGLDLMPLQPIFESLCLDTGVMDTWLSSTRDQEGRWTRFGAYFETGYVEIDLPNLMLFIDRFIQHPDWGGGLQNRIPASVVRRLGHQQRSVPALLTSADLLSLLCHGVIDARAAVAHPLVKLAQDLMAHCPSDVQHRVQAWSAHFMLSEASAAWFERHRQRPGKHETYFIFNRSGLLDRDTCGPDWAESQSLYRLTRPQALSDLVARHYATVAPGFALALANVLPELTQAEDVIALRDTANTLYYGWQTKRDGSDYRSLPNAAKMLLRGNPLPHRSASGPTRQGQAPRSSPRSRSDRYERFPLLEELMGRLGDAAAAKPKAYLVMDPGAQELPCDAPVFMPSYLWHLTSDVPSGVKPIETATFVWGEALEAQLHRQFAERFDVVLLR